MVMVMLRNLELGFFFFPGVTFFVLLVCFCKSSKVVLYSDDLDMVLKQLILLFQKYLRA